MSGSYTDPTSLTGPVSNSAIASMYAPTHTLIVVNYGKQMSSQASSVRSDHTLSQPSLDHQNQPHSALSMSVMQDSAHGHNFKNCCFT